MRFLMERKGPFPFASNSNPGWAFSFHPQSRPLINRERREQGFDKKKSQEDEGVGSEEGEKEALLQKGSFSPPGLHFIDRRLSFHQRQARDGEGGEQEGIVRALDLDAELLLEQRCDAGEAARAAGEIHGIHGMAGNMGLHDVGNALENRLHDGSVLVVVRAALLELGLLVGHRKRVT